jgi:hypothetical protein
MKDYKILLILLTPIINSTFISKQNLEKYLFVATDDAVDGLKHFVVGLGVDVDAVAVLRLVRRGHEDLKDADVLMQEMGKCKWKRNLKVLKCHFSKTRKFHKN